MKKTAAVWFLLPFLGACMPFYGMIGEVPKVHSISPSDQLQPGDSIVIEFSCSMDKDSVESAFRLSCGSLPVNGSFTWNNSAEMVFSPRQISETSGYVLELTYLARSSAGIPMERSRTHRFGLTGTAAPFELLSIIPDPDDLLISPTDDFLFHFNRSVDQNSFYSAFSINPQVEGRFEWTQENSRVRFIPQSGLLPGLHYQIEISADCRSTDEHPLISAEQRHYRVAEVEALPIEYFCWTSETGERHTPARPDECCYAARNEIFSVQFSDAVPPALHSTAVRLQPDPGADFEWSVDRRRVTLHMPGSPRPETVFQLKLGQESYYLQWDGPGTGALELTGVSYCNDSSSAAAEYRLIGLNELLDFATSEHAAIELAFSHSQTAEIPVLHLMEALQLYASNGAAALRLTDLQKIASAECSELNDLHPQSLFRIEFTIHRYPSAGRLHLQIAPTLTDSLGNTPTQEIRMSYNL